MTDTPWRYCIDTSALVHGWIRAYPPDVLQPFWDRMDALIEEQILVAPMDVLIELEKKEGDELHLWCKKRSHMFIEIDDFPNTDSFIAIQWQQTGNWTVIWYSCFFRIRPLFF